MSTADQVRLPQGSATITQESPINAGADLTADPAGRRYDENYLDQLADEAEHLGPPQLRRGRPSLGSSPSGASPRLSTRVPREVDAAVRAAAAREGITPAQWLRAAIEQQLVHH